MTGSIQSQKGVLYTVIPYKEGAKTKQKWQTTGLKDTKQNRKKAQLILAERVLGFQAEKHVENSADGLKMAVIAEKWLTEAKITVDITTWQGYYVIYHSYLQKYLENSSLEGLNREFLQNMFDELGKSGKKDGKPLSLKSLKLIRGVLSLILAEFPEKKQLCGQVRLKSEKPVSPVHFFGHKRSAMYCIISHYLL